MLLRRLRKIPLLNTTEVRSAAEASIGAEVMVNGVETAEIVVIVEVEVAELLERTTMASQLKLARNLSQEAEEVTVETGVAKEVTEATREVSTEVLVMELEVASAQERRELLNLPSHRISNEKFERRFGI